MIDRLALRAACAGTIIAAVSISACSDAHPTAVPRSIGGPATVAAAQNQNDAPAPAGLVTVQAGNESVTLWPFTEDGGQMRSSGPHPGS